MKSTNEELSSVNEELRNRNLELGQLNNDLSNLLSSTTLPVVMVDRGLRIRRVTAASAKTLKILPSDVGRLITDIRSDIAIKNLDQLIAGVIDSLVTKELEVQDKEGCWYFLRIRPYRTLDDKTEGAVLVLTDINLMKTASEHFQRAKEFAEGIIDTVREPLVVLDSRLHFVHANSAFFEDFKISREEVEGRSFNQLAKEQWNIPKLHALLEKLLVDDGPVTNFEAEQVLPGRGHRTILLNARRLLGLPDAEPMILLAMEDITARKDGEAALRKLASIVQSSDDAIISADLEQTITSWNAGAERIFGYTEKEAIGRQLSMMVPPELQGQEEEQIRSRLAAGEYIEHYDTVRMTKSGKRLDVSLTISPIRDAPGKIIGASKIARDISDRKALDRVRELSRAQLESLVEERTTALRSLSSRLMHMQDDEHRRIARELHDSVGQYLAAIKMTLAQSGQSDPQKAKAALSESQNLLDQCVAEVRTISYLLHPPLLDETGLASAAKWYAEGFGKRSNIQVQLEVSERIARLPNPVELALFRVLQESLTNVHRHSGSPKVDVRFDIEDGQVNLTVRDYGRGISHERLEYFKNAAGHLGVGLTGIRERIHELGGNLQILAEKPGTSVKVTIPMKQSKIETAQNAALGVTETP